MKIFMADIIREVAAAHGLSVADLTGPRHIHRFVLARHEAMWRCRHETGQSFPQIGRALGGRDHSTIWHGVRAHEQRRAELTA